MTERDVIVRCPGCGNGIVISQALGQVLRCDNCGTSFQAPMSDDASEPPPVAEPEGSEVRGDASPRPMMGATASGTGRDSQVRPRGSWRTDDLDSATRADSPAAAADKGRNSAVSRQARRRGREPSGLGWNLVAMISVGVILTAIVLGTFLIIRTLPSAGGDRLAKMKREETLQAATPWTDASKFSQRRESVTVKVERATYGALRAKDLTHQIITTEDDNLLGIVISVLNRGSQVRPFQNWYGHAFIDPDGTELLAELSDDRGRSYALLKFDDVSYIEGQRLADEIGDHESVQDTVVFLIPDEVDRSTIQYFRLSLPAAAIGLTGFFRFEIPVGMIEGFQTGETAPAAETGGAD